MLPTTHFAPGPRKLSSGSDLGSTTLITVTALAGVSGLVREAYGERVLRHANHAAMLDIEAIEDEDCFIPHLVLTSFADTVARLAGEAYLGLLFAPRLTIADKGRWGGYMLGAPTLGEAIRRGIATIGLHSKGDVMSLAVDGGEARLSYSSAAKGQAGYVHIALGSAGILLSLCRSFLPANWRPLRIEIDFPRPPSTTAFEDVFGCPVVFDAPALSVCFEQYRLSSPPHHGAAHSLVTIGDVARARVNWARPDNPGDVIAEQIWTQVLAGHVSIEGVAHSLDTSVRTLQRELSREGTSFRALANAIRARRAMELLRDTRASVTEISATLGYSAPAHFARAFRQATGFAPNEFRQRMSAVAA